MTAYRGSCSRSSTSASAETTRSFSPGSTNHFTGSWYQQPAWSAAHPHRQRRPGPDAELTLALQSDRLGVDPADQDQIPVHVPDIGGGELDWVVGMLDPLALRGE